MDLLTLGSCHKERQPLALKLAHSNVKVHFFTKFSCEKTAIECKIVQAVFCDAPQPRTLWPTLIQNQRVF